MSNLILFQIIGEIIYDIKNFMNSLKFVFWKQFRSAPDYKKNDVGVETCLTCDVSFVGFDWLFVGADLFR